MLCVLCIHIYTVLAKVHRYNIRVRKILCKQRFTVVKSGQEKVNIQICGFVWKVNTPKKVNNTWQSKVSNPNFKVRHICQHQSEVNTQGKASKIEKLSKRRLDFNQGQSALETMSPCLYLYYLARQIENQIQNPVTNLITIGPSLSTKYMLDKKPFDSYLRSRLIGILFKTFCIVVLYYDTSN